METLYNSKLDHTALYMSDRCVQREAAAEASMLMIIQHILHSDTSTDQFKAALNIFHINNGSNDRVFFVVTVVTQLSTYSY